MTEAESYNSLEMRSRSRKQAWKAWSIGLTVVVVWVLLILAAPFAKLNGLIAISSPLYHFFSFICHQISDRSFHIGGEQFGVCSRCFGVYLGLVVGFVAYPLWRSVAEIEPLPKVWLFFSLVPITIDWSLTIFGIWENTLLSRFITGIILGFACATYIIPSIVEITRNLTYRKLRDA